VTAIAGVVASVDLGPLPHQRAGTCEEVAPPEPVRVGLLAPPTASFDAAAAGGLLHLGRLAEGLAARGHSVTLIGAATAGLTANGYELVDTDPDGRWRGDPVVADRLHATEIPRILDRLRPQVVGDHTHSGYLPTGQWPVPTAVTVYQRSPFEVFSWPLPDHVSLVAVSVHQRCHTLWWPWWDTIPPAIPLDQYPLSLEHDGPALFLGPLLPGHGAGVALGAAHHAGRPIILAGTHPSPEAAAHADELARRVGSDDAVIAVVDAPQRGSLLARAGCLLAPLLLSEPYSLEILQALACGTPVIGLHDTVAAELVRPEASGLLVRRLSELPTAIRRVDRLDPKTVREHAARFDVAVMVRAYEQLFARLVEGRP